jgi:copper chaperone
MKILVQTMSCQHCVAQITKAVQALDKQATVRCDLDAKLVDVQSTATPDSVLAAIAEADYPAILQAS